MEDNTTKYDDFILNDDKMIIKKPLDYPSEDDLKILKVNGMYDMTNYDINKLKKNDVVIKSNNNDIIGDITSIKSNNIINKDNHTNINKADDSNDLIKVMISNAKKLDVDINIKLCVNIPYSGFFEMLDDDFVNNNADKFIDEIFNYINDNDSIKNQVKNFLVDYYLISKNKDCDDK